MSREIIPYAQSSLVHHLTICSLLVFLNALAYVADEYFSAGLIVQIILGLIYGPPIGNILPIPWIETFQALGDLGLILLVFHGGLFTNLNLLRANIVLSIVVAAIGILVPIALSMISFIFIFRQSALQGFTAGAAMCSTSLGTTMAILSSFSSDVDLRSTRIGTVLLSAAMIDDVVGLIMASVVEQVSGPDVNRGNGLAWTILHPVVASFGVAAVTPLVTRFIFAPVYRRLFRRYSGGMKWNRAAILVILLSILSALLAISNYSGTSMLFGAYVAGCALCYLDGATLDLRETDADHTLTFEWVFMTYIAPSNGRIFVPLFFATIGAAIPFVPLFRPAILWKGMLYSGLMFLAKFVTGMCIMLWGRGFQWKLVRRASSKTDARAMEQESVGKPSTSEKGEHSVDMVSKKDQALPPDLSQPANTAANSTQSWPTHPALLIAFAMVARGEIALIIAQIGRDTLGEDGFLVVIWAVVLCTLIGPLLTGILVRRHADKIGQGIWGEVARVGVGVGVGVDC